MREDMAAIAFDEDVDENGNPDNLIASGTVEKSPEWLCCNGSRWVLRIDRNGVRRESDLGGWPILCAFCKGRNIPNSEPLRTLTLDTPRYRTPTLQLNHAEGPHPLSVS